MKKDGVRGRMEDEEGWRMKKDGGWRMKKDGDEKG